MEFTTKKAIKKLSELIPAPYNPRKMSERMHEALGKSLDEFGYVDTIIWNQRTGHVVGGNQRLIEISKKAKGSDPEIEVTVVDLPIEKEKALNVALNKISGEWDMAKIEDIFTELKTDRDSLLLTGFDEDEILQIMDDQNEKQNTKNILSNTFILPPFSILDTRRSEWRDRKDKWISLGIESGLGRDTRLTYVKGDREISKLDPVSKKILKISEGTSVFDPVLCELMYSWFCADSGFILDPFAGGSVRGIVAAMMGYLYVGIDLSERQIKENENQWSTITKGNPINRPIWVTGDSMNIDSLIPDQTRYQFDFIFSCPPYYDLETYTDDPADLSNMKTYAEFMVAYRSIINKSVAMLKPDRFAVFVVGELRDKDGNYYGFVKDTIDAFHDAGAKLYNEIIVINAIGSLRLTVGKQFTASRKMAKIHQNALVFVKGDPKIATAACRAIDPKMIDKMVKIHAADEVDETHIYPE